MANTLVLSGGASKGDFEVGALQFLYENSYFANAICSTSVGSVNAGLLAQGGDAQSQTAAFNTLKSIWQTEMMSNDSMYTPALWLAGLSPRTRDVIADLYSGRIDIPPLLAEVAFCPPLLIGQMVAAGIDINDALNGLKTAQSVFTLDPVRAKLKKYLDPTKVKNSGVELRLVTVSLDSGLVRYVTQDGHVVETDNTPVKVPQQNACTAELAAYQLALQAFAAAGTALRQAGSSSSRLNRMEAQKDLNRVGAKLARAKTALDQCTANAVGKTADLIVGLADGIIASSSIPCVFPPVTLGSESYVDGGIRWQLPLKAALGFPSNTVVAINTGALGVPPPAKPYAGANLLEIAERSVFDLLLWEAEERHLELMKVESLQQGKRVWIIAPRVDVHDGFSVDPGLIDISIAYGYMCAADVLSGFPFVAHTISPGVAHTGGVTPTWIDQPSSPQLSALADAIVDCRLRCWEVEHLVFGEDAAPGLLSPRSQLSLVPDPGALDEVRVLKTLIGILVDARKLQNGKMPSDAPTWGDMYERHQWTPIVGDTPWKAFNSRAGTRPAATRATALLVRRSGSPEVFLLDPTKHLVAPASLPTLGGTVTVIPDEVSQILDAIPSGAPIP
jgi:predicted acylesterase/phospholipase RssA